MQEESENRMKKVNKKVSNAKMSKNQKTPQNQQNISESPQNVRLDTSESDEESVSEVKEPQINGLIVLFDNFFICLKVKIFSLTYFGHLCECYFVCIEEKNWLAVY